MPFDDDENLFRGIITNPNFWKSETNLPSSAAFKDTYGVSVDRQSGRSIEESTSFLTDRFDLKAVVHFTHLESIGYGAVAHEDAKEDNPYHCLLKREDGTLVLTDSVARKLSKNCKVCYLK